MRKKTDWSGKKIGLVLSGGGAKGAYQIGMLRALEELGLAEKIKIISGTSIGAMCGIFYAGGGVEALREMMVFLGMQFTEENAAVEESAYAAAKEGAEKGTITVDEFIRGSNYHKYSTEKFLAYMERKLPDTILNTLSIKVYVCAYSLERGCPEYFQLNSLEPGQQRKLTLASASLPLLFPPVEYESMHYLDGGCVPNVCGNSAKEADKIPLKPVLEEDVEAILVNYLIPSDKVDFSSIRDGVEYLELRPSYYLEQTPGAGTLDFSPENLQKMELLGYHDTMEVFQEKTVENEYAACLKKVRAEV